MDEFRGIMAVLALSGCSALALSEGELLDLRKVGAQQLLGEYYDRSVVKFGENMDSLTPSVLLLVNRSLPKKYKGQSASLTRIVIKESHKYGYDPFLLLAMIQTESSFNPDAKGGVGEVGLMQLRPETAKWICAKYKIPYKGVSQLREPHWNVRIGAAYVAHLKEAHKEHPRLYLTAFNMGPKNLWRQMAKNIWPKVYVGRVMKNYVAIYKTIKEKFSTPQPGPAPGSDKQVASRQVASVPSI